jgi:ferredoxin
LPRICRYGAGRALGTRRALLSASALRRFQRSNVMAYIITDACNKCGTCKDTCPSEAINEGDPIYVINMEECIECGACVSECPSEAIKEQ